MANPKYRKTVTISLSYEQWEQIYACAKAESRSITAEIGLRVARSFLPIPGNVRAAVPSLASPPLPIATPEPPADDPPPWGR